MKFANKDYKTRVDSGIFIDRSMFPLDLFTQEPVTNAYQYVLESRPKSVIRKSITQLTANPSGERTHVAVINMDKEDGMSWTAQHLHDELTKTFANEYTIAIEGIKGYSHQGSPLVTELIETKRFIRIVEKGLKLKPARNARVLVPLFGIASFAVLKVIDLAVQQTGDISDLMTSKTLLLIALSAVIAFITDRILQGNTESRADNSVKSLDEHLDHETEQSDAVVASLAEELRPRSARVIIIDDFNSIDTLTKRAIYYYLSHYHSSESLDYWIIFNHLNEAASFVPFAQEYLCSQSETLVSFYKITNILKADKKRLIEALKLPTVVEGYSVMKHICLHGETNYLKIKSFSEAYRKRFPISKDFIDELSIMFLLALDSSPTKMFLTQSEIVEILKTGRKIERKILEKFLGDKKIDSRRLPGIVSNVLKEFTTYFQKETTVNKVTRYAVVPEFKDALMSGEFYFNLQLPDPGLGHLFWAIYWGRENIAINRGGAGTLVKISHHIQQRAYVTLFQDEDASLIQQCLRDSVLPNTLNGCLSFGVFDEVTILLQEFKRYLTDEEHLSAQLNPVDETLFINLCWKSYLLTDRPDILDLLHNIDLFKATHPVSASKPGEGSYLEQLEALPLRQAEIVYPADPAERDNLALDIYLASLFTLFLLTSRNSIGFPVKPLPGSQTTVTSDPFHTIGEQVGKITSSSHPEYSQLELQALSNCFWNQALCIHLFDEPSGEGDPATSRFTSFLSVLTTCSQKISQSFIRKEGKKKFDEDGRYFQKAYILNFYASAFQSVSLCIKSMSEAAGFGTSQAQQHDVQLINQLFEHINATLSLKIPVATKLQDVIYSKQIAKELEKSVRLCTITTKCLGIESLTSSLVFKSFQYGTRTGLIPPNFEAIKASSSFKPSDGIYNILVNIEIGVSQADSIELKSSFFFDALEQAVSGGYGGQLQFILFICLLNCDEFFINDTTELEILSSYAFNEQSFADSLSLIPDENLEHFALKSDAFMANLHEQRLTEKIARCLHDRIATVEDEEIKRILNSLTLSSELVKKIKDKEQQSAVGQELSECLTTLEDSDQAFILSKVLSHRIVFPPARELSFNVIDRNYGNFVSTAFLHLAFQALRFLEQITDEEEAHYSDYLGKAIVQWESRLPAAYNIVIFTLLIDTMTGHQSRFVTSCQKWKEYKLKVDHITLLHMIANRKFFDYFNYCFSILSSYGLSADKSPIDIRRELDLPISEVKDKIEGWINTGYKVPVALTETEQGLMISSQFIVLGSYLFDHQDFDEKLFDNYRAMFNQEAQNKLQRLFDNVSSLELPESVKTILELHNTRFDRALVYSDEQVA